MKIRSTWNCLRGVVLELLGVALVIWLAAGFPGLSPDDLPGNSRHGTSGSPSPVALEPPAWPYQVLPVDLLPPPVEQRAAYTEGRLRPAGEALWELTSQTATRWLEPARTKTPAAP